MTRRLCFEYQGSLETLELKLSPSTVVPAQTAVLDDDNDPLPEPEPPPEPDPPIIYPPAPPSGPIGPG